MEFTALKTGQIDLLEVSVSECGRGVRGLSFGKSDESDIFLCLKFFFPLLAIDLTA